MRGQVYVPKEYLLTHGATRDDIASGRGGPGVLAAMSDMRQLARHHLASVRATCGAPSRQEIAPAFLPAALVEQHLR
jgi:15-cis-phytoene synthase